MGPKKKRKDEPPPEMGEGSKISALPQFVARHLEVKDERTGALRIWFASNNLKVCVCVSVSYTELLCGQGLNCFGLSIRYVAIGFL